MTISVGAYRPSEVCFQAAHETADCDRGLRGVRSAASRHADAGAAAEKAPVPHARRSLQALGLGPAEKAVVDWGKSSGFDATTLKGYEQDSRSIDLSVLTPGYLGQFDGLMLMTNGNLPLTDLQKESILDFVRGGKALIGVHCATLTLYDYPTFGDVLGGYYLRSIIPTSQIAQGRIGILKIEDQNHPATRMLGPSWPINEEFYEFGHEVWDESRPTENISAVGRLHILMPFSRDRVHVLVSLDTERTDLSGLAGIVRGGDYPQA